MSEKRLEVCLRRFDLKNINDYAISYMYEPEKLNICTECEAKDCAIYCCIKHGCMKTYCTVHMQDHHRQTKKSHTFVKLYMKIYP